MLHTTDFPTSLELEAAIRDLRQEYLADGVSLFDIGNGSCYQFAEEVMDRIFQENWRLHEGRYGWQTLETEQLYRPLEGASNTIDATEWDWDLLALHWGIHIPRSERHIYNAIIRQNPAHCWISMNGKHYDCEHPDGVDNFFDLKFFQRHLRSSEQGAPLDSFNRVPLWRLQEIACPVETPPWPEVYGCLKGAVYRALKRCDFEPKPVENDTYIERHAARIAYLIRYGWDDPIEIDLNVPDRPSWHPVWPITDGNHRLAAAVLRQDRYITAEITGRIDLVDDLLGISGKPYRR